MLNIRKNRSIVHDLPKPEKDIFIYALCEPNTDIVRYIGLSTMGFKRIKDHYGVSDKKKSYSVNWIISLRNKNEIFNVLYLEYFDSDGPHLDETERKYIEYYKSIGANLTNYELGGRRNGFKARDKEAHSRRLSEINSTPERKELFSKQSKARWADPEFREMMKNISKKKISKEDFKKINKAYNDKYGVKLQDDLGNIFNTLKEASNFHDISIMVIQRASITGKVIKGRTFKRLGGGIKPPSEIKLTNWVKRGCKPIINEVVDHNGVVYQNIKIACEALNIDNKKAHRLLNGEIKKPCGITLKRVNK